MTVCPSCGQQNIAGVDVCEACGSSLAEVANAQPTSYEDAGVLGDPIRVLPPQSPTIVAPSAPIGDVLHVLVDNSVGCVLVVEDDEIVGIFSERDALMRLNVRYADLLDRPVSEFMTSSPETLKLDDKIAFALHRMDVGGYRHVPILDEHRIAGIVSVRDILGHLTRHVITSH
ncbi:MAG: CBS domain-containing protein [Pirellulales bacterium]|nr:CBS domain-containing protein [Planctomycetales bacterium]